MKLVFLIAIFVIQLVCMTQQNDHANVLKRIQSAFNLKNISGIRQRINHLNSDILKNDIKENTADSNWLLKGYCYDEFYDWDLDF